MDNNFDTQGYLDMELPFHHGRKRGRRKSALVELLYDAKAFSRIQSTNRTNVQEQGLEHVDLSLFWMDSKTNASKASDEGETPLLCHATS